MSTLFEMDGRVVIVTGASSGIGAMIATGLAAAGAHVVLAARREDLLKETESRLPGSLAVRCDVGLEADRARLVELTLETFGHIDGLVNNAGVANRGVPATQETLAELHQILEIDLVAPFDLARRCLPAFRAQNGGSIINVTSTAAVLSCAYVIPQAAYCAAKGGLAQLTKELAAQWGRYGVRVNALAPGLFATEMTTTLDDAAAEARRRLMARVPLARAASAHDVIGVAQFLLSDASRYVTGQHIAVDGGYTIA